MGLWQVEQGFSAFFSKNFAYLIIFESFAVPLAHRAFYYKMPSDQMWRKFGKKNEENALVQAACLKNPYLHGISILKPRFWARTRSVTSYRTKLFSTSNALCESLRKMKRFELLNL